jgi:exopolyphosphatase/guanosine-5'-triphosphate,3'-diphosphate pyrophosphatase
VGTETLTRLAAIDIGSNAVRLLLCNVVEEHGILHYNKSELIRVPLRLGEDAFQSGRISAHRAERFMKTMNAFKLLIDVFEPVAYRACATASLREAKNGPDLIRKVRQECGLVIDIVSGKEEAELIYSNHIEEKLNHSSNYIYLDVGGGSTEITLFRKGQCIASRSFEIGTIRWLQGSVSKDSWEELKSWVREMTAGIDFESVIGSGGNINKIFKLVGKKDKPLPFEVLKAFYDEIKILSIDDRIDIWELNPDRADVIVPAAKIFLSVMKAARVPDVIVPQIGLSDGIVHQLYEAILHKQTG